MSDAMELDQLDRSTIVMGLGALTYAALRDKDKTLLRSIDRTLQKFGVSKLDLAVIGTRVQKKERSQS